MRYIFTRERALIIITREYVLICDKTVYSATKFSVLDVFKIK